MSDSRIRTLLDSSVLIAGLVQGHPDHVSARKMLDECLGGKRLMLVCTHGIAETYASLTALPVSPRISPLEADRLIRENVLRVASVVPLGEDDYSEVIQKMSDAGFVSGAVYDGLHVRAAEKASANELVTFNGRDFRRMPPASPCRLIVL